MLKQIVFLLEPKLVCFYHRLVERLLGPSGPVNLKGDRDVEYSWIAAHIREGPGEALDFGSGPSWVGFLAARKGFTVTALDLQPISWHYVYPRFKFLQGDIFRSSFEPRQFDLIISCSAVEHVGLAGRYGVTERNKEGDLQAMAILKTLLKPGKVMILTIPVGHDRIFPPLHRVYGHSRLPRLLNGWEILEKEYWMKGEQNRWISVDEVVALEQEPTETLYGLGLYVLRSVTDGGNCGPAERRVLC